MVNKMNPSTCNNTKFSQKRLSILNGCFKNIKYRHAHTLGANFFFTKVICVHFKNSYNVDWAIILSHFNFYHLLTFHYKYEKLLSTV